MKATTLLRPSFKPELFSSFVFAAALVVLITVMVTKQANKQTIVKKKLKATFVMLISDVAILSSYLPLSKYSGDTV